METISRIELERGWHESEEFARDDSSLIVGVYASGVFAQAEAYHLESLGDVSGKNVLDYGCGAGGTTVELLKRRAHVTGFDVSATRLEDARHLVRDRVGASTAVNLAQSSAEQLPFPSGAFDVVFGKQILHHLDLEVAVPEIARVLRPGGRAIFLEPLIHNPVLEGYRRLTPHLRSPTEKALSMNDLEFIASHFSSWQHKDFILLSILPALVEAFTGKHPLWDTMRTGLEQIDRRMMDALPAIGRYAWETVLVFER